MNSIESKLALGLIALAVVSGLLYLFRDYFSEQKGQASSEPARGAQAQKSLTLEEALASTRNNLFGRIAGLFGDSGSLPKSQVDQLEEVLYTSDLGPRTVGKLMNDLQHHVFKNGLGDLGAVRQTLGVSITEMLQPSLRPASPTLAMLLANGGVPEGNASPALADQATRETKVWMIVGVNGAGKTTTIGKLAHLLAGRGLKVLVAAGDTFRAAAGDQLRVWSERARVEIFSPQGQGTPSGVAFDACKRAKEEQFDIVLLDTAGRLHTQKPLMEELKKVRRVIEKIFPQGPEEALIVIDANVGQNAIQQAKEFNEAVMLTGVVLTKMDGSAKGGVAVGISNEVRVPIRLVGIGEGITDLRPFSPDEYVRSLI